MDRIQKGYYGYQFVPDVLAQRLAAFESILPRGSSLIDLGCNDGTISLLLMQHGYARSSIGIDFEDIRVVKPPEFEFISADLRHFDLASLPQVDVVLCLNVIHHLCIHGIDFARDFMAKLATRAGTVICEMGSLTARIPAPWLTAMQAEWQTDQQCWADLFQAYAWRRPMMTYPFQFGRRVMWKLVSEKEPHYEFEVLEATQNAETQLRQLCRSGTAELFWSKAYRGTRSGEADAKARSLVFKYLKDCPFDCMLPLTSNPAYGDIYAFDPELTPPPIAWRDAIKIFSLAEMEEGMRFGAQIVPDLGEFPLDMLCDFQVARTSRGLTFLHFEPSKLAVELSKPI